MGKIFVGLIFTMLGGIRMEVGAGVVNLLPAFAGYILMAMAFRELSRAEAFRRSWAVAWLAAVVSGAVWLLAVLNRQIPVLNLAARALNVYLTWMVAIGVEELEKELEENLNAGRLKLAWMAQLAAIAVTAMAPAAADPFPFHLFFSLAATLLYLIFFYQSWRLYKDLQGDGLPWWDPRRGGNRKREPRHSIRVDGPEDWPYEASIRRVITAALRAEGVDVPCVVEVWITDNEGIRRTNLETRGIDSPTDVLSFPGFQLEPGDKPLAEWADPDTGKVWLGEMMISLERAREQAVEYNHSLERELCYLSVHSALHLLGYDHMDEGLEKARMREREETILESLELTRG